ncbi:MAG: GNAT family N-acetyltransferase [Planctomycetales bacterium]|nr:GNAT family N-acetyltransferase [Planctomycetales bacterium]
MASPFSQKQRQPPSPPAVEVCREPDLREALTLALRTLSADQRAPLVDSLSKQRGEPLMLFQGLVVAKQAGEVVAACWAQPQPGKGCSLWTPQFKSDEPCAELSQRLIERAVAVAQEAGVSLVQTLLESPHDPMHEPLQRCGFQQVTRLYYLEWKLREIGPVACGIQAEFEPYDPANPRRLESLISATYRSTLDFPELDKLRDVRDVVNGYKRAGEFRPELWNYITARGRDLGVLLLTEYPDSCQLELVYIGLIDEVRGKGLVAVAVNKAQQLACELNVDRIVLAVDARNTPADALYRRAGFREWADRFVYLRANRG